MPTQTYTITPDQFQAYLVETKQNDFSITPTSPTSGTAEGKGVTLKYAYDGTTLTLTGLDKPWIVSWSYVWGLISEHLTA